jgi:zona occludens toxin (predicted ATPase)
MAWSTHGMFTFLLDFLIGRIAQSTFWLIKFFVKLRRSDDAPGKSARSAPDAALWAVSSSAGAPS